MKQSGERSKKKQTAKIEDFFQVNKFVLEWSNAVSGSG